MPRLSRGNELVRAIRILLSPNEERRLDSLVARVRMASEVPVNLSNLLRSFVILLFAAEREIGVQVGRVMESKRPTNNNVVAIRRFERQLAQAMLQALRSYRPGRSRRKKR